ncbi:hypothetical protein F5Y15DRAFT_287712 [Xylariaceae sp. FL0016]|nr:hypothetical protein F5Y15DRAFT_287712 [Xylariaceae sp. FL0016]
MSRFIDTLPAPQHVVPKKIISLGASRTGSYSLLLALRQLGYKVVHMSEVAARLLAMGQPQDPTLATLFEEALRCKYQGKGKPYGRAEFDKWLAEFDAILEIPEFFVEEFVAAYPDAKFILTEREPDKWVKSVHATAWQAYSRMERYPLKAVRHLDAKTNQYCTLMMAMMEAWNVDLNLPEGVLRLKAQYLALNETSKKIVPENQLLVLQLEEGITWDKLCPFLEKPAPNTPYPKSNERAEHNKVQWIIMGPAYLKAVGLVVTAGLGFAAMWYWAEKLKVLA